MTEAALNNGTRPASMDSSLMPRIAPFILFMSFIGIEELARTLANKGLIAISAQSLYYLYPVKTISVAFVLYLFRKSYHEIELRQLLSLRHLTVSALCGIAVFVMWIHMNFSLYPLDASRGFNPLLFQNQTLKNSMIIIRLAGAVLVVPVMEELFWRSFFLRYIVNQNFANVAIGTFTWSSFLVVTLFFGLEHDLFFAGIMAGIAYNLLLYYTRSIAHCILAHALTNLLLGIYVLATHRWYFW
jgi:uncharacterized protein